MSIQSPQSNNSWLVFFFFNIMPLPYVADDKFKILDKRKNENDNHREKVLLHLEHNP